MVKLRNYQEEIASKAVEVLKASGLVYLAMECRTGKTITALSVAQKYGAKSVLVVSKIKAIPSIKADYEALHPSFSLEVVNYESASKAKGAYDLVLLDEAHTLGAFPKPSKRTQVLKGLCAGLPIVFMSGTPTPESYSQLYHQLFVSSFSPFKEYVNFYKWAKRYVTVKQRIINGYTVNDYSDANKYAIDSVTKHLFLSYTQEEAGFSTNIVENILEVKMNASTKSLFDELRRNKVADRPFLPMPLLADTPAKMLLKLHQISSGTIVCGNGEHIVLDGSKAEFIKTHFKGQKIAVFYIYKAEEKLLKNRFPNWTDSPEEFQASADKVFISQVRRAREGVRLDTADALIFLNLEYSYLSYEQGKNRLVSKERKEPANVYFLCSDFGVEKEILNAVHGKKDFTLSYYYKRNHTYNSKIKNKTHFSPYNELKRTYPYNYTPNEK